MIGQLEAAVVALHETLHACFRARQLLRRLPKTVDALLEERERARQLELFARELANDGVEPLKTFLESHGTSE